MKYMLMMNGTQANFDSFKAWPPQDLKAHIDFFNKELTESGAFVSAEGLAWPDEARVVRARPDGTPAVTDGPFPEARRRTRSRRPCWRRLSSGRARECRTIPGPG